MMIQMSGDCKKERYGYLSKREWLSDEMVVFESPDYDKAIIGTTTDDRVVYSFDKMCECLVEDGMTHEEASEFIEFNTVRALPYVDNAPVIMYTLPEGHGYDD